MTLFINTHATVYKNPAYYCGPGPSVVCDPDMGQLCVVFRRVKSWLKDGLAGHWHPGTETCITQSSDLGETWSPPRILFSGWQCPCLTRISDGTLIHSSHRFEIVSADIRAQLEDQRGLLSDPWPGIHAGTAVHRSTDDGQTWSEPTWLSGVPGLEPFHESLNVPVAVRGNVLEVEDGRLLVSAYGFEDENTAYLFESSDRGETWTYRSVIAEGYNETYLYETVDGHLLAWMRGWGDRMDLLHLTRSEDGGATWSEPSPQFKGYPAAVAALGSGDIVLAYGYRFEGSHGVRARRLSPEGESAGEEVAIRDDGATFDLGYPHAVSLPDGRVFVVYYISRSIDAPDRTAPRYIESCIISG